MRRLLGCARRDLRREVALTDLSAAPVLLPVVRTSSPDLLALAHEEHDRAIGGVYGQAAHAAVLFTDGFRLPEVAVFLRVSVRTLRRHAWV